MSRNTLLLVGVVVLVAFVTGWRMAVRNAANQRALSDSSPQTQVRPDEAASPYPPDQIERWIAALSQPVDDERALAEKELANAGVYAQSALQAAIAHAAEPAKAALGRLLERLRFLNLATLDYPKALPAGAVGYVYANDIEATLDDLEKTTPFRLWKLPALDAVRPRIESEIASVLQRERHPPIQFSKKQAALTVFTMQPGVRGKLGVLLELKGTDPQGDYFDWVQTDLQNGGSVFHYKDIECVAAGANKGAHTRTGRHIIFGSDREALEALIDGVLKNDGLGARPGVQAVSASLSKRGVSAVVDIPAVFAKLKEADPAFAAKVEALFDSALIGKLGYAGFSSACRGRGFEERLVCLLPEGQSGIAAALTAPASAHPPLELMDTVPVHAFAAGMGYVDGAKLEKALLETFQGIRALNSSGAAPAAGDEWLRILREREKKTGAAEGSLLAHLKGEVGFWIVARPGALELPIDIGALLTAPSPRSALELAEILRTFFAELAPASLQQQDFKGHKLYEMKNVFPGKPWSVNWTAVGNRVFLATGPRLLERHLDDLEKRAPGLLTHALFTGALGEFSAEERQGSVLYADVRTLLLWWGVGALQALRSNDTTPPDIRKMLAELPAPQTLFQGVPPLLGFTVTRKDRGEWVLHSPIPIVPVLIAGVMAGKK